MKSLVIGTNNKEAERDFENEDPSGHCSAGSKRRQHAPGRCVFMGSRKDAWSNE